MSEESINESLSKSVIRLGNEARYYAIEAKDFESKWIRVMEDNEKLRAEIASLKAEARRLAIQGHPDIITEL